MPSQQKARAVLGLLDDNATTSTPSKKRASDPGVEVCEIDKENTPLTSHMRHSRTPQSEGKRFVLDMFVTPSKRKRDMEPEQAQEQSNKSFGFSTPAFLRRRTVQDIVLHTISEEESTAMGTAEGTTATPSGKGRERALTVKPFGFRKTLGRSFSSLIAEVKKAENERLDDEMDVLREMEQENCAPPLAKAPRMTPTLQVEDSQMALGPDGTHEDSHDESEALLQQPTGKIWKKKGAKRQTRRVILRPTAKQPPRSNSTQPSTFLDSASSASTGDEREKRDPSAIDDSADVGVVQETQLPSRFSTTTSDGDENSLASDYDDDDKDELDGTSKARKSESSTAALNGSTSMKVKPSGKGIDTPANSSSIGDQVKKAARKVNQAAHANYRRLNIRSKGGGGGGGAGKRRFGKRR